MKASKFVILDLDNTLLYAKPADFHYASHEEDKFFHISLISHRVIYKVTLRKHFKKFMDSLFESGYRVIIWSAGEDKYVKDITSIAFKNYDIEYTLTVNHLVDGYKNLQHIKKFIPDFDIENSRLVDDNTKHKKGQHQYFIQVKPFAFDGFTLTEEDETNDKDHLLEILEKINQSFIREENKN